MKKSRKLSAIILATIMALSVYSPTNATESVLQEASSKIKSDLQSILLSSEKNDEIPVDIWLYEPISTEQLEKEIDLKIGITKQKIKQSEEKAVSSEKVDEYIDTERALYSEKMNALYKDFLKDYSKISALNEKRSGKRLFFSQYAPLISAELTSAEIKQLAKDDRVQSICYSPDVKAVPQGNISVPLIGADFVRDDAEFTGVGIKIGLLEADALPNKNKSYFTSTNIIYDPTVPVVHNTFNYHPDRVACIMVAKAKTINGVTYKGIAPDAMLYATYVNTDPVSDWREKIEWLISEGVNIINMSVRLQGVEDGYDNGVYNGEYGAAELWLDHIALNHCIHIVVAAGNRGITTEGLEGDKKIDSPGMAYNVITVGNINDINTANQSDDTLSSSSSYVEEDGLTNKPDLVAPGTYIGTHIGEVSGTSFAAPHVSAVIAELCEMQPYLKVEQETMKAILTASINHIKHAYTPANTVKYDKFGAGVVNAKESFMTIAYSRYASSSFAANSPPSTAHYYNYTPATLDPVRVSLSWLKFSSLDGNHINPSVEEGVLADLSLAIYDPNGNLFIYSNSYVNNTEIVQFKPTMGGTYTIRVTVTATTLSDKDIYYGLAWAVIDDGID